MHHRVMDDRFICPDCYAEHTEPLDAALGHLVRCLSCALAVDAANDSPHETLLLEIHIAA
jgi:hypothetical protein